MQKKTIFMVDDNIANLAMAEEALEAHYLLVTLSSAEKMFVVLEKVHPDLILLDIDMPGMDGLEAIKILKKDDRYDDIPVIFLTGLTGSDTEAYSIELGAVDFITKPFSQPVLLNRIKNHLHISDLIRKRLELVERVYSEVANTLDDSEEATRKIMQDAGIDPDPRIAEIFKNIRKQVKKSKAEIQK